MAPAEDSRLAEPQHEENARVAESGGLEKQGAQAVEEKAGATELRPEVEVLKGPLLPAPVTLKELDELRNAERIRP